MEIPEEMEYDPETTAVLMYCTGGDRAVPDDLARDRKSQRINGCRCAFLVLLVVPPAQAAFDATSFPVA